MSHRNLELIKHKVVYLISALPMVWDYNVYFYQFAQKLFFALHLVDCNILKDFQIYHAYHLSFL